MFTAVGDKMLDALLFLLDNQWKVQNKKDIV